MQCEASKRGMGPGPSVITRRGLIASGLSRLLSRQSVAGTAVKPPLGMVLVPGGTYLMGTDGTEIAAKYGHFGPGIRGMLKCEIPRHEETVDAFFMDRCEVTNQQFYEFVRAHPQWQRERILSEYHNGDYLKHWDGGRFPQGTADHPVVYVSWLAAMACSI